MFCTHCASLGWQYTIIRNAVIEANEYYSNIYEYQNTLAYISIY